MRLRLPNSLASSASLAPGLAVLAWVLAAGPVQADESRIATQSLRCSAVFAVFIDANAGDAALTARFVKAQRIFDQVYAGERRDKSADAGTEIAARRAALLKEFRDNFKEREPYLHEEGVLCGAWAEGFLSQGENWAFIPVIPKVIAQSARDEYARIGPPSFTRWAK